MGDWIILQSGSALGLYNHTFTKFLSVFIVCTERLVCTPRTKLVDQSTTVDLSVGSAPAHMKDQTIGRGLTRPARMHAQKRYILCAVACHEFERVSASWRGGRADRPPRTEAKLQCAVFFLLSNIPVLIAKIPYKDEYTYKYVLDECRGQDSCTTKKIAQKSLKERKNTDMCRLTGMIEGAFK